MTHLSMLRRSIRAQSQSRRKRLWGSQCIGGPIQCVTAVVDGATGFRRIMHSAKVLPFRRAHFGAGYRGARRAIGEEGNYDRVHFLCEEPTELVQPEGVVNIFRWMRQLMRHLSVHCQCRIRADGVCEEIVEGF